MKSFDPLDYTHGLNPSRLMNHKATSLVCNSVGALALMSTLPSLLFSLIGMPFSSIVWGAWAKGMATSNASMLARFAKHGMGAIRPSFGLRILADMMRVTSPEAQVFFQDRSPP